MSNVHAPRIWLCTVKAHKSMRFFDEPSFRKHMESDHGSPSEESQLNLLVRINSIPLARPLALCPLCGGFPDNCPTPERQDEKGLPDQLPRHVSGHLKELALLALPPRVDIYNSERADTVGDDNESRISLLDEPTFQDYVHHTQTVDVYNSNFRWNNYVESDHTPLLLFPTDETYKQFNRHFTENGEHRDKNHRLKTDVPGMTPELEKHVESARYVSQSKGYGNHSFLSINKIAPRLDNLAASQSVMDPSWLDFDRQVSDSMRDDEWGFSKWTQFPPYAGQLQDPKLKGLVERAVDGREFGTVNLHSTQLYSKYPYFDFEKLPRYQDFQSLPRFLRKCMSEQLRIVGGKEGGGFLPLALLKVLLPREVIEQELKRENFDLDPATTAKIILGIEAENNQGVAEAEDDPKTYLVVFAILALLDHLSEIARFFYFKGGGRGVCDQDLPLEIHSGDDGSCELKHKSNSHRIRCFEMWTDRDHELFYQFQWRLLVPTFALNAGGTMQHQELADETIFPWFGEQSPSYSEVMEGGFGVVKRVKIHPFCYEFHELLQVVCVLQSLANNYL